MISHTKQVVNDENDDETLLYTQVGWRRLVSSSPREDLPDGWYDGGRSCSTSERRRLLAHHFLQPPVHSHPNTIPQRRQPLSRYTTLTPARAATDSTVTCQHQSFLILLCHIYLWMTPANSNLRGPHEHHRGICGANP